MKKVLLVAILLIGSNLCGKSEVEGPNGRSFGLDFDPPRNWVSNDMWRNVLTFNKLDKIIEQQEKIYFLLEVMVAKEMAIHPNLPEVWEKYSNRKYSDPLCQDHFCLKPNFR